ncbi:MAG: DUF5050 domain-containing protein [Pyrinomonadaceae bacterium]
MKLQLKLKSIRLSAIALALAFVCAFITFANANPNRTASIFAEISALSSMSRLDGIFGASSDSGNSNRTDKPAVDSLRTPPANGKIAFTSHRNGNREIYVMDADGANQTRLTSNTITDSYPSFSPDGRKIAYFSFRDVNPGIYIMNADGSNQTHVPNTTVNDTLPVFSPDGGKIAFSRYIDDNLEIYITDIDGTNQTRLTTNPANDSDHSFSPDGGRIIFTSDRDGNSEIYLMSAADGSNLINLTNSQSSELSPSYSPDGGKILFSRGSSLDFEIFVMNADQTNQIALTNNSTDDFKPSFSPDGSKIVFTGNRDNNREIYTMNSDGTNEIRLTNNPTFDDYAAWQPVIARTSAAGEKIVFTSLRDGNYEIYTMNPDGTNQTRLTNNPMTDEQPSFSPDGTKIVFASNRDVIHEIYIMNSDGTNQTRLTSNDATDIQPSFSPDGSKIVFISGRIGGNNVFIMNSDGANVMPLTTGAASCADPMFSPDGSKIVYSRSNADGMSYDEIYVMNADGSNQTNLTNNYYSTDSEPSFSPDGSKIVFTSNRDNWFDIYVMDAAGSANPARLTVNEYIVDRHASYSPDGSKITFEHFNYEMGEIYTMDADGANPGQITNNSSEDLQPRWQTSAPPAPCTFSISPSSATIPGGGASGSIDITASDSTCAWTLANNTNWIEINAGVSGGTGSSVIGYSVGANTGEARAGTLTIGGQTFSASQESSQIGVYIPTGLTGMRNTTTTIPVKVANNTTGRGIISFDFMIEYNSNLLGHLSPSFDQTGTMSSNMTVTVNNTHQGELRVSGYGTTPLSGSGTLLNLTFTVQNAPASCTSVFFDRFQFNDGVPAATRTNGEFCIEQTAVTGIVTYANAPAPLGVRNVNMTASGSSNFTATTAADGSYSLDRFIGGNYTVTPSKSGEINNAISGLDSSQIARYSIGLTQLSETRLLAAEVSGNNLVNSYDAALIAQFAANISNPGSAGTWKFLPASRSYSNITANLSGQDYSAILMGDVTGNWTPPSQLAARGAAQTIQPDANAVAVGLPTLNAARNQTVIVPISVGDVTGRGFIAYDFEISYNPSVLQPDVAAPVNTAGTISSNLSVAANPNTPGRLFVTAYGINELQGAGTLLNLRFKVIGQGGQASPLNFERLVFNENPAQSVTQNGQLTVLAPTSSQVPVGGRITRADGNGISGARITMTDAQGNVRMALSGSLGYYRFDSVPVGTTCVIAVSAKQYSFGQPAQAVSVNDKNDDINFVAGN